MNTDTPRTDEWLAEEKRNPRLSGLGKWPDYCKQLERELTAVTYQRDRLAEALDRITISGCGILCRQIATEALQSLTTND
jgi:hypothetical protein